MAKYRLTTKLFRQLRVWAIPILIAVAAVIGINSAVADPLPTPSELQKYVQKVDLVVHSETVDGYQQVYYEYNDQKVYVTSGALNHINPKASGHYITWIDSGDNPSQVYLYDIFTSTTIQLSSSSTNFAPDIDGNHVVWQQWVNGEWQVMYYDGDTVRQISSGNESIRPHVSGTHIAYVQDVPTDTDNGRWHIIEYDTVTGDSQVALITPDETQAWPHFTSTGGLISNFDLDYASDQ